MTHPSDERLNELLKQAYPSIEVSPDFTLRLWRKLMNRPPVWAVPARALAAALTVGIVAGLWSWPQIHERQGSLPVALARVERLDLFGNAPHDTMAGSWLRIMEGHA